MVAMRDGVRLATDIYLPSKDGAPVSGRFPVIVIRTPYRKASIKPTGLSLASHGYAVVAQDCRGRFDSEGEFYAFVNEGTDGYDTIEWAAAQEWSNGKVGTSGPSYLAWDQYHAAMYRPPHLTAMFAGVGGANFYQEFGHPGGATNLGWPLWLARSAQTSPQAAEHVTEAEALTQIFKEPAAWLGMHPKEREKVFEKFPAHLEMYRDFYEHPTFDHYWQQRGFDIRGHHGEMKDVPALFVSGWYDYFSAGVLENFASLSKIQQSGKKLIMGPWWHATGGDSCGDASFAQASQMDETAIMLGWFDHWLKQEPMQNVPSSAVSFYRMGGGEGGRDADGLLRHGGEWLSASSWPPEDVAPARWYLRSGGQLAQQKPGQQQPDSYVFDPDHPVPTIGGRFAMGPWSPRCVQDQVCKLDYLGCEDAKPLAERSDVLVYQTEPLDTEIEVTGPISATLWVSSDRVDTDFTAKLIDVHPDGYAMILAEGQIRARYRHGFDRTQPLEPGATHEVVVQLGSTSNLFTKGHRIRVDISSSNYPNIEPNPNTGEPPYEVTRRVKANNIIFHDSERPSFVELPQRAAR
jgi:hypothetical protein